MFPPGTTLADYIPGTTVDEDRTVHLADGQLKCHWVLLCAAPATHVRNSILGHVPACPKHADGPDVVALSACRWCGKQIHQLNELGAREANKAHPADADGQPPAKPDDWVHGVAGIRCPSSGHEHEPDDTDN